MSIFLLAPTGDSFPLPTGDSVIGSDPAVTIPIVAGFGVAARHARLRVAPGRLEMEALDENAPVLVNGRSVRRCGLLDGDHLAMGLLQVTVKIEALAPSIPQPLPLSRPSLHSPPPAIESKPMAAAGLPPMPLEGNTAPPPPLPTIPPPLPSLPLPENTIGQPVSYADLAAARIRRREEAAAEAEMKALNSPVERAENVPANVPLAIISSGVAGLIVIFFWHYVPKFHWSIICLGAAGFGKLVGYAVRLGAASFNPGQRFYVHSGLGLLAGAVMFISLIFGDIVSMAGGPLAIREFISKSSQQVEMAATTAKTKFKHVELTEEELLRRHAASKPPTHISQGQFASEALDSIRQSHEMIEADDEPVDSEPEDAEPASFDGEEAGDIASAQARAQREVEQIRKMQEQVGSFKPSFKPVRDETSGVNISGGGLTLAIIAGLVIFKLSTILACCVSASVAFKSTNPKLS